MRTLPQVGLKDTGEPAQETPPSNGEVTAFQRTLISAKKATQAIASLSDFARSEETFVRELAQLLDAEGCATYRWNRYENKLSLAASYKGRVGTEFAKEITDLTRYSQILQVLEGRQAGQIVHGDRIQPTAEQKYMVAQGIRSMLLLPMVAQDRTLGLVQVTESRRQRTFGEQETIFAQLLANQAASAIQSTITQSETERRLDEQAILRRASTIISSTLDLQGVLSSVAEQMCRVVNGTSAYILHYDQRQSKSTIIAEYMSPHANDQERESDLGAQYDLLHEANFMQDFLFEGQPVHWYSDEEDFRRRKRDHYLRPGGQTVFAIPMRYGSKVVAYAEIWDSRSRRSFTPDEIALVQAISQQAVIAYDHARLHSELEQQAGELAALNRISQAITSTLEFQETLDIVARNTLTLLGVEAVVIALLDKSERYLRFAAVSGLPDSLNGRRSKLNHSIWGWSVQQSKPLFVPDASTDKRHDPTFDEQSGLQIRAVLCAPLQAKGQTRGAIAAINKRDGKPSKEDMRLLTSIAQAASTALENAILYERARREIGERRKAEERLESERQSLADQVSVQTAELRKTNAELAHAVRLKDEFLASMSHELRTPLNAILGIAEGLLDQFYGSLNERQTRSVQLVEHSGRHLLALINDILDVSKIESGELMLEKETVPISSICAGSLQFIKLAASKKNIAVHSEIDEQASYIQADSRRLKQILINLLSNAVKFTPDHGAIGLQVAGDPENEVAQFTVWDTGIGIAQEDIPRIFRPFVQLDSSLSRQFPGTGLGLSLVKRMTEMHGGSVSVESSLGQGSRFTVTLPWQPSSASDLEAISGQSQLPQTTGLHTAQLVHQPSRTRILLAEDDQINAEIFIQFLESLSYQVILAKDGREAVNRCREERPALILMDIQMPGMNGLEAIQEIRSDSRFDDIPIIALTALAMAGDQERCMEAGANDYMTKPVPLRQLKKVIRSYLR
jgi:signal transduction histidine kinase/CheY-like chemotaxis protein